jgi:outer membrane lipoprotein-sorting protein
MMKKIIFFKAIAFLITFQTLAQPQGYKPVQDITKFKNDLTNRNKTLTSIQSSFTQEKHFEVLADVTISKGIFYFKSPNKLRWEYTQPYFYLVVLNNNKVMLKDEEKQTHYDLNSNKIFKEVNDVMMGAVKGTLFNDIANYKSKFYENTKFYLVELAPTNKNIQEYVKTISIYFDKKDLTVSSVKMVEPEGDYSIISFSGKNLNAQIAEDKFLIK